MLLDEIIEIAVDNKHSLTVLLRKCLLLAYQLKNDQLKSWANQELNGYKHKGEELPPYRIIPAQAKGNFSGRFGSGFTNWPIAPMLLEERHRLFGEVVYLFQAVSAYEDSVKTDGILTYYWDHDLQLYYQQKLSNRGYVLTSAWQEIPKSAIVEILETIRNRTLNMALELREDIGDQDPKAITPAAVAQAERTITNNIFGGTNYFASEQSTLHSTTSNTTNTISVGDKDQLAMVLKRSGLSNEDLEALTDAQNKDGGKTLGIRVMEWAKQTGSKVLAGGVKIGTEVGQKLLMDWLKQYYG